MWRAAPREPKGPAGAPGPTAADLREAEGRRRRREADVAEQRQAEAAGDRGAVDGGDDRDRQARQVVEQALAGLDELLLVGPVAPELGHVHARAEGGAGTGED